MTSVQPDQYVQIETDWLIEAPLHHDWSLFIHLTTPDGVIVGQRDVYPGGGKLATSDLAVGYYMAKSAGNLRATRRLRTGNPND